MELDNEDGLVDKLMNKIKASNEKDWKKLMKCTLRWYRLAKDDTGVERCVRLVQDLGSVRLLFWLRTGSAVLLEDKTRSRMASDERCVMCNSGVREDVAHFVR